MKSIERKLATKTINQLEALISIFPRNHNIEIVINDDKETR